MSSKRYIKPDWRHTLYQFHHQAVEKYGLRPSEIAVYTAMLSLTKPNGTATVGHIELQKLTGIKHVQTLKKARDKLIESGIITIRKQGNSIKGCTVYDIKLMGTPTRFTNRPEEGEDELS